MTWQTGSSSSHPEDLHQVSQERQEVINSELEKLVQFLPSSAHSHWVLRVGNMSFNNETLWVGNVAKCLTSESAHYPLNVDQRILIYVVNYHRSFFRVKVDLYSFEGVLLCNISIGKLPNPDRKTSKLHGNKPPASSSHLETFVSSSLRESEYARHHWWTRKTR